MTRSALPLRHEVSATALNTQLAADIASHTSTYNVVIFGNDGNTSAGDQDSIFAQNLDTWAQQGRGGVIGVGWALFGSLGESAPVITALDDVLPVTVAGHVNNNDPAGSTVTFSGSHPITAGVSTLTLAPTTTAKCQLGSMPAPPFWGPTVHPMQVRQPSWLGKTER